MRKTRFVRKRFGSDEKAGDVDQSSLSKKTRDGKGPLWQARRRRVRRDTAKRDRLHRVWKGCLGKNVSKGKVLWGTECNTPEGKGSPKFMDGVGTLPRKGRKGSSKKNQRASNAQMEESDSPPPKRVSAREKGSRRRSTLYE